MFLLAGSAVPTVCAQAPSSYEEFLQSIYSDFENFRQTILDHYADFLNGTWHEYEPLMPLKRDHAPKPMKVPDVRVSKPSVTPVDMPTPRLAELPPSSLPVVNEEPSLLPQVPKPTVPPEAGKVTPPSLKVRPDMGTPLLASLPESLRPAPKLPVDNSPSSLPVGANVPDGTEIAKVDLKPIAPQPEETVEGKEPVMFYGMEVPVDEVDFKIMNSFNTVGDFARNWRLLDEQGVKADVLDAVMPAIRDMGLNDYLTYEFLCAYMDGKFPEAPYASRLSAVHYLLANMGYNARIAMTSGTGDALMLMSTKQTVYGKPLLKVGGENYCVLAAPGVNVMGQGISTCDLPKAVDSAKKFDLIVNGLNLPVKECPYEVNFGGITLSGTVNENLMPVVYNYPQMDTSDYALSELDGGLRRDLVGQLKSQLADKGKLAATNQLLQFVQQGFDYATDDDFHGFEKPYFLEENLYYPKNDCEDRAILYTYLLWHALGVESHLLFFPGHESVGVALDDDIRGTSYEHEGKRYYISDPTYIGSTTGQCMPQYVDVSPVIDLIIPQ